MKSLISKEAAAWYIVAIILMLAGNESARAQNLNAIYTFTGGSDGASPKGGLTMDGAGNLYGTTTEDTTSGCGTVFKLAHKNSGWVLSTLYTFNGGQDGCSPDTRLLIGGDGKLYGTTAIGGGSGCGGSGCGTVFSLTPVPFCKTTFCNQAQVVWKETVLYRFAGGTDGAIPLGDLVFDQAGNLYGTAIGGGYFGGYCAEENTPGCGVVFELAYAAGNWTEIVIYAFTGGIDGTDPEGGVILDKVGNLYGANGAGTIYELTPSPLGWTFSILHRLQRPEGSDPHGNLLLDDKRNLYGTTAADGPNGGGTVYELTPSGDSWTFSLLYSLDTGSPGPSAGVTMDKAGNLYGPTLEAGHGWGTVYKLTHSNGSWTYSLLHEFNDGSDGALPSALIVDGNGNLFGTAEYGGMGCGEYGCGVVFEITPN